MNNIELVVFDWDGTLMDSTGAITESIQLAAADLNLPIPSDADASHVIGLGLQDALKLAVPSLPGSRLAEFVERYRVHYFERDQVLRPFAGAETLLLALNARQVPTAIATGKSRIGLDRALQSVAWQHFFKSSRCADEGLPKPDPWMLNQLCQQLGVAPQQTVMIGDTSHDLRMAQAAGAWSVAVTYGAHPEDELRRAGAVAYCDSPADLQQFLLPRCINPARYQG